MHSLNTRVVESQDQDHQDRQLPTQHLITTQELLEVLALRWPECTDCFLTEKTRNACLQA